MYIRESSDAGAVPREEEEHGEELRDYKFYCFDGEPMYCQVISGRYTNETIDFFDMSWEHQPFTGLALPHHPFSEQPVPRPVCFGEMRDAAAKLSAETAFVRVDLYEISGRMYFGEMTFFPASGFGEFIPSSFGDEMSSWLKLTSRS